MDNFQRYSQILLWPLEVLEPSDFEGAVKIVDEGKARPDDAEPAWKQIPYLGREAGVEDASQYAEYVYFHRFAQRFLYPSKTLPYGELGPKEREEALFAIWARNDVAGLSVRAAGSAVEERLDVKRIHFYLFKTQVAILVVEVEADRAISRRSVLAIQNELRRAYTPFFYGDGKGGLTPEYVVWLDRSGLPIPGGGRRSGVSNYHADHDYETWVKAEAIKRENADDADRLNAELTRLYLSESRAPQLERLIGSEPAKKKAEGFGGIPVASHWAWLLPHDIRFDYIEDDRIPQMHHLQVAEPHKVTRGDLIRLCFADGVSTNPDELPYGQTFLSSFENTNCYDRFWEPGQKDLTTRYMCCGYGFTMLTNGEWFAAEVLHRHFRHHYFQLGLLAHYHRASLLRFSRRLSEAQDDGRREVRREFAEFTNRHWFREVSNQDQGRELFTLWSRQLKNGELFDQVHAESTAVEDILSAEEERRLSAAVDLLTRCLLWLALLTLIAAALTLAVAFLDMEAVRGTIGGWLDDHEPGKHVAWKSWPWVFKILGGIAAVVAVLALLWTRKLGNELKRIRKGVQ